VQTGTKRVCVAIIRTTLHASNRRCRMLDVSVTEGHMEKATFLRHIDKTRLYSRNCCMRLYPWLTTWYKSKFGLVHW